MIDSIFIVHKKSTDLLLYTQINKESTIDDLESVLGAVVGYAESSEVGKVKNIGLSQGKFVYGNFDTFYMIFLLGKNAKADDVKKIMGKMAEQFASQYKDKLENYSGEEGVFEGFTTTISKEIKSLMEEDGAPKVPKVSVPKVEPSVAKPIDDSKNNEITKGKSEVTAAEQVSSPKIEPAAKKPAMEEASVPASLKKMKLDFQTSEAPKAEDLGEMWIKPKPREMYPEGIPEYTRDEVLWNEAEEIKKMYNADYIEDEVAKLEIFLDLAATHSYRVVLDFRNYPERPILELPEHLVKEMGAPIEQISYFLKNWDIKVPAHPYELIQELEKILLKYKADKKISPTADFESLSNTLVLEPLPNFVPLAPMKPLSWESKLSEPEQKPKAPQQTQPQQTQPQQGKEKEKEKENEKDKGKEKEKEKEKDKGKEKKK